MKLMKEIWIPDVETFDRWGVNYDITHWKKVLPFIKDTGNALDIGAHVGIWSKRMAQLFDKVYAFEPIPKHIECHKKNLETFNNIVLHEVGLSNKNAEATIKQSDYNSGMSTLEWKQSNSKQNFFEIPVRTLDSYEITEIDFIKIDVEGHEINVIEGAKDTLTQSSPIIFVEIWHKELKRMYTAKDALRNLGYREIMYSGGCNYIFAK